MMATSTQPLTLQPPEQLRRLNLRRDLRAVADLVELAFAEELDRDGRRYIRQMRASARTPQLMGLAGQLPAALTGFVWEEAGVLVGNLSMIPVRVQRQRCYLIANVAVHPEQRRRGIAMALTRAALEDAQRRGAQGAWLQVRANNPAAVGLYRKLGFSEMARRSTWHSTILPTPATPAGVQVRERRRGDWPQQQRWLQLAYPSTLTWQLPLAIDALRPGMGGVVNRMLNERDFMQWSATQDEALIGTLTWQSSHSQADWLWLGAAAEHTDAALQALLPHALRHTPRGRTCALDHPAGENADTLRALGFHEHVQLIWMRIGL